MGPQLGDVWTLLLRRTACICGEGPLARAQLTLSAFPFAFPGLVSAANSKLMTPTVILWVYIVLLVVGGVMGLQAGSKISLYMSVGFAALLSLCALHLIQGHYAAEYILIAMLLLFGWRLAKSKKFMPMGLMTVATIVTLALRQLLR